MLRGGSRAAGEQALTSTRGALNGAVARAIIGAMPGTHTRGEILVVDDEPTIGDVVSRYLERAGYATRVAATVASDDCSLSRVATAARKVADHERRRR